MRLRLGDVGEGFCLARVRGIKDVAGVKTLQVLEVFEDTGLRAGMAIAAELIDPLKLR